MCCKKWWNISFVLEILDDNGEDDGNKWYEGAVENYADDGDYDDDDDGHANDDDDDNDNMAVTNVTDIRCLSVCLRANYTFAKWSFVPILVSLFTLLCTFHCTMHWLQYNLSQY